MNDSSAGNSPEIDLSTPSDWEKKRDAAAEAYDVFQGKVTTFKAGVDLGYAEGLTEYQSLMSETNVKLNALGVERDQLLAEVASLKKAYVELLEVYNENREAQELKLMVGNYRSKLSLLCGWLEALNENRNFTEDHWPTVICLIKGTREALEKK